MNIRTVSAVTVLLLAVAGAGVVAQVSSSERVNDVPQRPALLAGCPTQNLAFHTCAVQKARTFRPRRTSGGRPDLQGYWVSALTQPFSVEGVAADDPMALDPFMPWEVAPPEIVDPADGKIPYQPWAVPIGRRGINFTEYIDPRTTCSTAGLPRLALQDASQILQPPTGDQILWLHDDHHQFRVIPMGQRPPVGRDIKTWNGLAQGRWDGNTLVIETTNLNGDTWIDDSGNFYTDGAHITERLTMLDADTIHYALTIEDTNVYTRPWTIAWALVRVTEANFQLLEEACREGERTVDDLHTRGYKYYFGAPWRARGRR